jgi:hypothetical protein
MRCGGPGKFISIRHPLSPAKQTAQVRAKQGVHSLAGEKPLLSARLELKRPALTAQVIVSTAERVRFVIVLALGKVFEDAQEFIVPQPANDFDVARFRLC